MVSLGERLRPQGERLLPLHGTLDERLLPQHGTLGEKIPPQHGTLDEKIPPQHGTLGEKIPPQHGTLGEKIPPQHGTLGERYQGEDESNQVYLGTFEEECMLKPCEELVRELPNELQERVNNIGNRASRETVCQLLIDLPVGGINLAHT